MDRSNLLCAAVMSALLIASPAMAQTDAHHAIASARAALAHYGDDLDSAVGAIEALGGALSEAQAGEAEEARFLRAVAAADVMVIARAREDADVEARVASAWGGAPDALLPSILEQLIELQRSPRFGSVARDALAALRGAAAGAPPGRGLDHLRAQVAYFHELVARARDARDVTDSLAEMGVDPCPGGGGCPPPYDLFGSTGRRAIRAVELAFRFAAHLPAAAERGDPFAAAVTHAELMDVSALRQIRLAPQDWGPALRATEVTHGRRAVDVDAVIVVGRHSVRFGRAPEIVFDETGRPQLGSRDGVVFGHEDGRVALPSSFRSHVEAIEGLGERIGAALPDTTSIGIAVERGVEAHVLSRVLYSVQGSQLPLRAFVASGPDDVLHAVEIHATDDDRPGPGAVRLYVRMGGFTVSGGGSAVMIPRVRSRAGSWRFDYPSLRGAISEREGPRVISYMATADAAAVLRAAMIMDGREAPVTLRRRR